VFAALMSLYLAGSPTCIAQQIKAEMQAAGGTVGSWAEQVYGTSFLANPEKAATLLKSLRPSDSALITGDPAWKIFSSVARYTQKNISPRLTENAKEMKYLRRLYMEAQMDMAGAKTLYPDANLTLRVAYGKVGGIQAGKSKKQGIYQTTLGDVVALDDSASASFKVPAKLKELYRKKDFGRWAVDGDVPVAFTASNHTTGGNSGSPVLDSRCRLIGLNFDRAYEGTMSDYCFSERVCRNIAVDIRYVLFITDRFGGCGRLVDEMKLVED
jgi:Peptidase S46